MANDGHLRPHFKAGSKEGDTGVFSNAMDVGSVLGKEIYVPIFDNAMGNGANAQFHLIGFASIILHDYKDNGPEAGRFLEIQFTTAVISATCCGGGASDGGLFAVGLCKVEGQGICP